MRWLILNPEHRAQMANGHKGIWRTFREGHASWPLTLTTKEGTTNIGVFATEADARREAARQEETSG